jgi:hypothetical protein
MRVWNDDICERLRVAQAEEKLVQYRLKLFEHFQWRLSKTLVHSGVISRTGNGKRGRWRIKLA